MTVEGRRKLEADAQKWLYGAIRKAATATGCLCRSQAELNGLASAAALIEVGS